MRAMNCLVVNDLDVNKLERLSKYNTWTQIKVTEKHFFCPSRFHSHGMVFNNEHNSYPKMSVKQPLDLLIMLINTTSIHFCRFYGI